MKPIREQFLIRNLTQFVMEKFQTLIFYYIVLYLSTFGNEMHTSGKWKTVTCQNMKQI